MKQRISVAILDDDESFRACLRREINHSDGLQCVGAFDSCKAAFTGIDRLQVDVVLVDIKMPTMDGIEGIAEFKQRWPRMKALVLTFSESRDIIFRSLAAGAHGYLLKSTPREELAEAIRSVHHGGAQISQQVLLEMVRYFRDRQNLQTKLTAAEQRVLAGREEGRSLKEIADELRVTVDTVKFHIKHILDKLGASSSAEAAYLHRRAASL